MAMTIKLLKLIKYNDILIYGVFLSLLPLLIKAQTNFINILVSSNYITLIINTYVLIVMYKTIHCVNQLKFQIITRVGLKKARQELHVNFSIYMMCHAIVLYMFLFILFGIQNVNYYLLIVLLSNTLIYLIEINFIVLQFNKKNNILYIIFPLAINFLYHYIFFVK